MRKLKDAIRYQQIRDAGFTDGEISFFDLMAKSESEICAFMPIHFFQTQLLDRLNGAGKEVLADKLNAHQFFNSLGIRTPELIGVWHPIHGVTKTGHPMTTAQKFTTEILQLLSAESEIDVFFKPRSGGCGRDVFGVTLVKSSPDGLFALVGNSRQPIGDFLQNLPEMPYSFFDNSNHGWLIEKKVQQHPDAALLNPSSLNTIRLNTYSAPPPEDGTSGQMVVFDYANFRVGRAGSDIDNGSTGGLLIKIDADTGRLERGRYLRKFGGGFGEVHPDSGINFIGHQLPFWEDAIAMCVQAARALPHVRSIGWDVALSEEGPLIIEGNTSWHAHSPQLQNKGYFSQRRRAIFEVAGDPTTATQLPRKRALPGQSKPSWAFHVLRERIGY